MTDPQAPPMQERPASTAWQTGPSVPVVRAARATAGMRTGTAPAPARPVVQRDVAGAGGVPPGVPVTAVPPRPVQRTPDKPPGAAGKAPGKDTVRSAGAPQDPGIDLDELARRLLDPLARLLRADLRRGRERAGRPYDGRR
ncbi:hypothetical protein [Streptomyces sp. CoH27]|uniref:hypothetical protein n=1 Tax=Streptomyces sp. CoH27 TaxID=2875763 RepID=UPI001CD227C4|nr:hypothetical protein [Streptomyces sp. CoH27]